MVTRGAKRIYEYLINDGIENNATLLNDSNRNEGIVYICLIQIVSFKTERLRLISNWKTQLY